MTQFLTLLVPYIKKTAIVWKTLFSKKGIVLATPLLIAFKILPNTIYGGILLAFLMVLDFVTGLAVSRKERNEAIKKETDEIKRKVITDKHLVTSEGLKRSGVKFALYGSTLVIAWCLQTILELRSFQLPISELHFTITLLVVLFWNLVEVYSIVFENFKKLGFDVWAEFMKLVSLFKNGKSKLNE